MNRYNVGDAPTTIATGPGSRVWVSVTGADKLIWFDATSASPTAHDGPTGLPSGRWRSSTAATRGCTSRCPAGGARSGSVAGGRLRNGDDMTNAAGVFDLAVANGKLFAPDYDGDAVCRHRARHGDDAGGVDRRPRGTPGRHHRRRRRQPLGHALGTGHVGRFAGDPQSGTVPTDPDGRELSERLRDRRRQRRAHLRHGQGAARTSRASQRRQLALLDTGGEPWQIVNGPDGDLFFTDQSRTRVLRFLSGAAAREHRGAGAGRGHRRERQRERRHARQRHPGRLRLRAHRRLRRHIGAGDACLRATAARR